MYNKNILIIHIKGVRNYFFCFNNTSKLKEERFSYFMQNKVTELGIIFASFNSHSMLKYAFLAPLV